MKNERLENGEIIDANKVYALIQDSLNNMTYGDLQKAFNNICPEKIELNQDSTYTYTVVDSYFRKNFELDIKFLDQSDGTDNYSIKVINDSGFFEGRAYTPADAVDSGDENQCYVILHNDFKELIVANGFYDSDIQDVARDYFFGG